MSHWNATNSVVTVIAILCFPFLRHRTSLQMMRMGAWQSQRFGTLLGLMMMRRCSSWMSSGCSFPLRLQSGPRCLLRQRVRQSFHSPSSELELVIPTSEDIMELGALIYSVVASPDTETCKTPMVPAVICLDGDLGAGKTAFCQGFVRAATRERNISVTSPTYLLSNTYKAMIVEDDNPVEVDVHHMDLYRLSGPTESLNLQHVFARCIALIEWPDRLGVALPKERLDIHITIMAGRDATAEEMLDDKNYPRKLVLVPFGKAWYERIQLLLDEGYVDDLLLNVTVSDDV